MKPTFVAAFALLCISQAHAQTGTVPDSGAVDTPAAFFANDPGRVQAQPVRVYEMQVRSTRGARAVRVARAEPRGTFSASVTLASGGVYALVDASARRHGVPANIARAAVRVESKGRCNARGRHGELGPLQIKPATARGLGYSGSAAALATCSAGLEWGMRHLAIAYRKCGHVGPHNYGLGGGCRRTAYVRKVMGYA